MKNCFFNAISRNAEKHKVLGLKDDIYRKSPKTIPHILWKLCFDIFIPAEELRILGFVNPEKLVNEQGQGKTALERKDTMKKALYILMIGLLVVFLGGIAQAKEKVVTCGTEDGLGLLKSLSKMFEKENPGTTVEVLNGMSGDEVKKGVADKKIDIGWCTHSLTKKDKKQDLGAVLFAYSPVVFVAHPRIKGVDKLTEKQIVDIYSGKLTDWSHLGGPKSKISVLHSAPEDPSRIALNEHVKGFKKIKKSPAEVINVPSKYINALVTDENAIGYGPLEMTIGTDLKVLKLNGIYPTFEPVYKGEYRLVIPVSLVYRGKLKGAAAQFIDFVLSSQGQKLIKKHGIIPVEKEKKG